MESRNYKFFWRGKGLNKEGGFKIIRGIGKSVSFIVMLLFIFSLPGFAHAEKKNIVKDVNIVEVENGQYIEVEFNKQLFDYLKLSLMLKNQDYESIISLSEAISTFGITIEPRDSDSIRIFLPQEFYSNIDELYVQSENNELWPVYTKLSIFETNTFKNAHSACNGTQCTDFIHCKTRITFRNCRGYVYTHAKEWYNDAQACKFDRSPSKPKDDSILVSRDFSPFGHVMYVKDSKKKNSHKYVLTIEHRNSKGDGRYIMEKVEYNKDKRKIYVNGNWRSIEGFIYKWDKEK